MSAEYKDQDVRIIAQAAERDLNSHSAKHGHAVSDTGNTPFLCVFTDMLLNLPQLLNQAWMQAQLPSSLEVP